MPHTSILVIGVFLCLFLYEDRMKIRWMVNNDLCLDVDDGLLSCCMKQNDQWTPVTKLPVSAIEKIYELCSTGEIYKYMKKPKSKIVDVQTPIELSCCTGTVVRNYLNNDIISGRDYGDESKD